ncbi:hypothetical protein Tco_1346595 [Tanacetum coccineum]
MTRSSTNELFTPYKEPEREFRSSRRHFKTLSLDELRSPDFNILFDEEYLEEEEEEEMAETMEQYMSKTRTDYGSGVSRPKIDNKDKFELKGQFLKELRENTFSGSDNEDANEHIEKVLKIVDFFHVPNITILDSRGVVPTKTAAYAKTTIQEMAKYSKKWHNGTSRGRSTETSDRLAAIQAQLNNLGREIKKLNEKVYAAQVGHEQCKGPHYTKDCPLKEEGKTLEEAYYTQFSGPFQGGGYRATAPGYYQRNNANPSFQERRQSMEDTLNRTVKYLKGIVENVLVGIGKFTFPVDFITLDMPEDIRVPLILERQFLVYMLSLRERMELDLEARLIGETLVINRSLDPFLEDYIELNDLNEPFELRRNQVDDLMPTIEEGEVIEKFRVRNEVLDTGIDDYPNYCDDDKNSI